MSRVKKKLQQSKSLTCTTVISCKNLRSLSIESNLNRSHKNDKIYEKHHPAIRHKSSTLSTSSSFYKKIRKSLSSNASKFTSSTAIDTGHTNNKEGTPVSQNSSSKFKIARIKSIENFGKMIANTFGSSSHLNVVQPAELKSIRPTSISARNQLHQPSDLQKFEIGRELATRTVSSIDEFLNPNQAISNVSVEQPSINSPTNNPTKLKKRNSFFNRHKRPSSSKPDSKQVSKFESNPVSSFKVNKPIVRSKSLVLPEERTNNYAKHERPTLNKRSIKEKFLNQNSIKARFTCNEIGRVMHEANPISRKNSSNLNPLDLNGCTLGRTRSKNYEFNDQPEIIKTVSSNYHYSQSALNENPTDEQISNDIKLLKTMSSQETPLSPIEVVNPRDYKLHKTVSFSQIGSDNPKLKKLTKLDSNELTQTEESDVDQHTVLSSEFSINDTSSIALKKLARRKTISDRIKLINQQYAEKLNLQASNSFQAGDQVDMRDFQDFTRGRIPDLEPIGLGQPIKIIDPNKNLNDELPRINNLLKNSIDLDRNFSVTRNERNFSLHSKSLKNKRNNSFKKNHSEHDKLGKSQSCKTWKLPHLSNFQEYEASQKITRPISKSQYCGSSTSPRTFINHSKTLNHLQDISRDNSMFLNASSNEHIHTIDDINSIESLDTSIEFVMHRMVSCRPSGQKKSKQNKSEKSEALKNLNELEQSIYESPQETQLNILKDTFYDGALFKVVNFKN